MKDKSLEQSVEDAGNFFRDVLEQLRQRFDDEGLTNDTTSQLATVSNAYSRLVAEIVKLRRYQAQQLAKMLPEEKDEACLEHLLSRPPEVIRYSIDELESAWLETRKKHRS